MTRRRQTVARIALTVATVGLPTAASADWNAFGWGKRKEETRLGYHRNNAWPDPFTEVDARAVVEPFERMKRNGWQLHNTLASDLFRDGDGALLAAGSSRVRWIATQAPRSRRQIYVSAASTQSETQARLASVRQTLDSLNGLEGQPQVLVTTKDPVYSSGDWANRINRAWLENLPDPKLPAASTTGAPGATP